MHAQLTCHSGASGASGASNACGGPSGTRDTVLVLGNVEKLKRKMLAGELPTNSVQSTTSYQLTLLYNTIYTNRLI